MGRCCFYAVGTLSLLLLVTSITLLVARVFQKAVDQTIEKVRRGGLCVCVCVCVCVCARARRAGLGGHLQPTLPLLNLVQGGSAPLITLVRRLGPSFLPCFLGLGG